MAATALKIRVNNNPLPVAVKTSNLTYNVITKWENLSGDPSSNTALTNLLNSKYFDKDTINSLINGLNSSIGDISTSLSGLNSSISNIEDDILVLNNNYSAQQETIQAIQDSKDDTAEKIQSLTTTLLSGVFYDEATGQLCVGSNTEVLPTEIAGKLSSTTFSNDGTLSELWAYSPLADNVIDGNVLTDKINDLCEYFFRYTGSNTIGTAKQIHDHADGATILLPSCSFDYSSDNYAMFTSYIYEYDSKEDKWTFVNNRDIVFKYMKIYAFICRDGRRSFRLAMTNPE